MDPTSTKGSQPAKRSNGMLTLMLVTFPLTLVFAWLALQLLPQPYSKIAVICSPAISTLLALLWPRIWFFYHLHWHKRRIARIEGSLADEDLSEEARKALQEGIRELKAHLIKLRLATLQPTHEEKSAAWLEAQSEIQDVSLKMLEVLTVDDARLLIKLSDEQQQDLAVERVLESLDPA